MADYTPPGALPSTDAVWRWGIADVAIAHAQTVYVAANGRVALCEKDQTIIEAACVGVSLNSAAAGQPIAYQISGQLTHGGSTYPGSGEVVIVGAGPGALAPEVDATTGDFSTVVGVSCGGQCLQLQIVPSGVAHA